jgi:hypothetical protein
MSQVFLFKKLFLNKTSVALKSSHQVDSQKKKKNISCVVAEGGEISKWKGWNCVTGYGTDMGSVVNIIWTGTLIYT